MTRRRLLIVALAILAASAFVSASASAHTPRTRLSSAVAPPQKIIFPVIGRVSYSDDFGSPRAQGGHPGNDILAKRKAPVVAAESGRVVFWTTSASAGCMLYLYGHSGTTYQYIHLNNDLTRRNDNRGSCVAGVAYAAGLQDGDEVGAGELVGYVEIPATPTEGILICTSSSIPAAVKRSRHIRGCFVPNGSPILRRTPMRRPAPLWTRSARTAR